MYTNKILNYFMTLNCQIDEVEECEVLKFIQTNCDKNDIIDFCNMFSMLNECSDIVLKIYGLM